MRRSSEPDVELHAGGASIITAPKLVEICFRYPAFFGQFVGHDSFQAARRDRRAATRPASDVQVGRVAVAQAPQFALGPPLLPAIHRNRVLPWAIW